MDSLKNFKTINDYIINLPKDIQESIYNLRETIKEAAPEAYETIKYRMPTFVLNGNLVHFAVYKKHIGFYPTPSGIKNFEKDLSAYKTSKGAVQFPIDKPLPIALIKKIVQYRVQENTKKLKQK